MRSTNIVIFLVLLNATAGFAGVLFAGPLEPDTGVDGEIQTASEALSDKENSQPSADEVTGSILGNADIFTQIQNILFLGPNMLVALGMPSIFSSGFKVVFGFVISFDIAEAVTGRQLS
jgi:hypothetical protein